MVRSNAGNSKASACLLAVHNWTMILKMLPRIIIMNICINNKAVQSENIAGNLKKLEHK